MSTAQEQRSVPIVAAEKIALSGVVEALRRIEAAQAFALVKQAEYAARGHHFTAAGFASAAARLRAESFALVELSL